MSNCDHEPVQDVNGVTLAFMLGYSPSITVHVCKKCGQPYVDPRILDAIGNIPLVSPEEAADAINQAMGGPYLLHLLVERFNHEDDSVQFRAIAEEEMGNEMRQRIGEEVCNQYPQYDVTVLFGNEGIEAEDSE